MQRKNAGAAKGVELKDKKIVIRTVRSSGFDMPSE